MSETHGKPNKKKKLIFKQNSLKNFLKNAINTYEYIHLYDNILYDNSSN